MLLLHAPSCQSPKNKYKQTMKTFTFIDLFAGVGGIRIPFEELGGTCVLTSEWDKHAQKTYEAMHGDKPHGDIHEITTDMVPQFDVLLAGFPCQPFSHAGKKQGFSDTRGTLFFEIERLIKDKQPKAFLLENVKGLKNHDKGRTLQVIVEHLEKLGYIVQYTILNARDFGLPQNRERIFLVGFKDKKMAELFMFPVPPKTATQLGAILEKKVDPKYTISDRLWQGHQRRKEGHKEKGNGFGYNLYTPQSVYTATISARYYKDGSEILVEQKGKNPRKLTPLEAGRLQGFPDHLIRRAQQAGVSDNQLYKQCGNSVAVNVIRAIATNMVKALENQ